MNHTSQTLHNIKSVKYKHIVSWCKSRCKSAGNFTYRSATLANGLLFDHFGKSLGFFRVLVALLIGSGFSV
jgi:hypothetical protein